MGQSCKILKLISVSKSNYEGIRLQKLFLELFASYFESS